MRRLTIFLALLMLLTPAAQALTLPYPEDTVLSVVELTDAQRMLVEYLYTPVFNHEESIKLPRGTRYDDVSPAMNALMQDYPELFHLWQEYTVSYYRDTPEIAVAIQPQYLMNAEEAASIRTDLYVQACLLTDANPGAQALHDALCGLVVYGGDDKTCHTAVGALLEGRATCAGYANALTFLYRMAGIPCGMLVGETVDSHGITERHAWNIARLEDFTLIDATWNDQDRLGMNTHWYFGLSTRQMGEDHFPEAGQSVPPCGEQDNWHLRQGAIISTQAQADAAIRRLVDGETINLRITNDELYQQLAHGTYDYLTGYNERNPDAAFYGAYSVSCSDAQGCVVIRQIAE